VTDPAALAPVLDTLIPPDAERGMPGAGSLGIAEALCREVPELAPFVDPALAELDALARERGAADFAGLPPDARETALREVGERHPSLLPGLLFQTYQAYYAHPSVLAALGVPPRPPHPEGYEVPPNDLTLLDHVRSRPKLYREV
jgi:hypothetical protein